MGKTFRNDDKYEETVVTAAENQRLRQWRRENETPLEEQEPWTPYKPENAVLYDGTPGSATLKGGR